MTVREGLTLPRLRFDRVALRVIESLRARLDDIVPPGKVLVVTVTAPIRLASKTVESIENLGRTYLNRLSSLGVKTRLHGNQVRLHLVKSLSAPMSSVAVFVHNPDSDMHLILGFIESLLFCLNGALGHPAPKKSAPASWLILAGGQPKYWATYRQIYDQLTLETNFGKILMVFEDGRVESLTP